MGITEVDNKHALVVKAAIMRAVLDAIGGDVEAIEWLREPPDFVLTYCIVDGKALREVVMSLIKAHTSGRRVTRLSVLEVI